MLGPIFLFVCFNGVQLQPLRGHNNSRIRHKGIREKIRRKKIRRKGEENEQGEGGREGERERERGEKLFLMC